MICGRPFIKITKKKLNSKHILTVLNSAETDPEVIKIMLSSAKHEISLFINIKMPTDVVISTFTSMKNSIQGLSEPEKAEFLDILILMKIQNFMLS